MLGMQKLFKIIDIDNSGSISLPEFKKAVRDSKLEDFTNEQIGQLFNIFDENRNGSIDYKEFIKGIRGTMNDYRQDQVERVFVILDKSGTG